MNISTPKNYGSESVAGQIAKNSSIGLQPRQSTINKILVYAAMANLKERR